MRRDLQFDPDVGSDLDRLVVDEKVDAVVQDVTAAGPLAERAIEPLRDQLAAANGTGAGDGAG